MVGEKSHRHWRRLTDPSGVVALKPVCLLVAFQDEEESLSEAEEHDAVDDGEGEHVPSDHLEDHGDKRPRQLDRSAEEHEIEPGENGWNRPRKVKANQLPGMANISIDSSMFR